MTIITEIEDKSKEVLVNSFSRNLYFTNGTRLGNSEFAKRNLKRIKKGHKTLLKSPACDKGNCWVDQCDTGHIDCTLGVKTHIQLFLTCHFQPVEFC